MRAQQLENLEGPDGLHAVDIAEPAANGRVLIDVRAAGVSFPDVLLSRGLYQLKPPLPFIPGVEVCGVIRSAPRESGFTPGERVAAFTMLGGFADAVAADAALVARVPEELSDAAAGGFVLNYHTVHFALGRRGRVRPGDVVAIHGAAGGIGTAAIQVATALGADVVALVSSAGKAEVAQRAGAGTIIDVHDDWVSELRAQRNGAGVDVILDPVGGDRFEQSVRCLAPEGRLLVVGFTEGRIPTVQANRLLLRNVEVIGVAWGAFLNVEPALFAQTQRALDEMIAAGHVRPIIGATFPLERAADALRLIEQRQATGKIVLAVR